MVHQTFSAASEKCFRYRLGERLFCRFHLSLATFLSRRDLRDPLLLEIVAHFVHVTCFSRVPCKDRRYAPGLVGITTKPSKPMYFLDMDVLPPIRLQVCYAIP